MPTTAAAARPPGKAVLAWGLLAGLGASLVLVYGLPKMAIWFYEQVIERGRLGLSMLWIASVPGQYRLSTWMRTDWRFHQIVIAVCLLLAPLAGAGLSRVISRRNTWLCAALFAVGYTVVVLAGAWIAEPAFSPFGGASGALTGHLRDIGAVFATAAVMSTIGALLAGLVRRKPAQ